jgi:hypothetical protein
MLAEWFSYLNTSLYTGDFNYIDIPATDENYWQIPCQGSTIQGNTVEIVSLLDVDVIRY